MEKKGEEYVWCEGVEWVGICHRVYAIAIQNCLTHYHLRGEGMVCENSSNTKEKLIDKSIMPTKNLPTNGKSCQLELNCIIIMLIWLILDMWS